MEEDPDAETKERQSEPSLPAGLKDGRLQLTMALGCYLVALFALYAGLYPLWSLIGDATLQGVVFARTASLVSAYGVAALFAYRGSTPARWFLSFLTVGSFGYVVAELAWWKVAFPHVIALLLCVIAEALLFASPDVRRFRAHQRQRYGKPAKPPEQAREALSPEASAKGRQMTLIAGGVLAACALFMQLLNSGAFSSEPPVRRYNAVQALFFFALLGVVGSAVGRKRWARSVLIGLGFVFAFFHVTGAFGSDASEPVAFVLVGIVELAVALVLWRSSEIRRYFGVS